MKNLANCTPREFLVQSNKIRHSVSKWLDLTKIFEIRKNKPSFNGDETEAQKRDMFAKQIINNADAMLSSILEDYPDETVELLALMCFVEPEYANHYKMTDYIKCLKEMLDCPEVIGFFTSLIQLAQMRTSASVKA